MEKKPNYESFGPKELEDPEWLARAKKEHPDRVVRGWLNWWDRLVHNMPSISIETLRTLNYGHYIGYMTAREEMQKELDKVEEDLMNERLAAGERGVDGLRLLGRITELEKTNATLMELLIDRQARGDYYRAILTGTREQYYEWGGAGDRGFVPAPPSIKANWIFEGKQNVDKILGGTE